MTESSFLEVPLDQKIHHYYSSTRNVFIKRLDNETSIFIDYENDRLRFCGQGNANRRPVYGVTIEKVYDHELEREGNEVIKKLNSSYLLSSIFGCDNVGPILEEERREEQSKPKGGVVHARFEDNYQFEERVMDLVYDIASTLQLHMPSYVTYFIGEYDDNMIERCGYKLLRGTLIEGVLKMEQNKAEQLTIKMRDKTYIGSTQKGRPQGEGSVAFNTSSLFCGYSQRGKMSFGCYGQNVNMNVTSCWSGSTREGIYMECYGNGFFYFGYCENGKKKGKGVHLMDNGAVMLGTWKDNLLNGICLVFSHIPTIYNGELSHQCFNGYGEMYYRNTTFYCGSWDGGQYNDLGCLSILSPSGKPKSSVGAWNHGTRRELTDNEKSLRDKMIPPTVHNFHFVQKGYSTIRTL